jgi:wobble nucleotide-excising tRNase
LAGSAKQLVVLTHNPLIAREFYQGLMNDGDCKTLHVVRNGQSSRIEECSLFEETAGMYYQNYKTLEKFINDGDSSQDGMLKAAKCIRPLLEGYLRNKYPGVFGEREWLGDFIEKIKASNSGEPLSFVKTRIPELESINDYSKRFHHDSNTNQTIIETELSRYAKKGLNFIYQ